MYVYVCLCISMYVYVYVYVLAMTFAGLRIVLIIVAIHRSAADPITTGVSPPSGSHSCHGPTDRRNSVGGPKRPEIIGKPSGSSWIIMDQHPVSIFEHDNCFNKPPNELRNRVKSSWPTSLNAGLKLSEYRT